jgi:hypothetical protein
MRLIDRTGMRFGRLVVIERDNSSVTPTRWLCRCDCGVTKSIRGNDLKRGQQTCGCVHKTAIADRNRTHGRSHSPEHRVWNGMRTRCADATHPHYGGRGIKVCERWNSFENFFADMGPRPTPKHSIDRIDSDGPYSPENCRWATIHEQARNRRSTVFIEHNGETKTMTEWAAHSGINLHTIRLRLVKFGWSVEEALSVPASAANKSLRYPRKPCHCGVPSHANGLCGRHYMQAKRAHLRATTGRDR